ncbi:hypothetical protein D3C86_2196560 [compost metagenome]
MRMERRRILERHTVPFHGSFRLTDKLIPESVHGRILLHLWRGSQYAATAEAGFYGKELTVT